MTFLNININEQKTTRDGYDVLKTTEEATKHHGFLKTIVNGTSEGKIPNGIGYSRNQLWIK